MSNVSLLIERGNEQQLKVLMMQLSENVPLCSACMLQPRDMITMPSTYLRCQLPLKILPPYGPRMPTLGFHSHQHLQLLGLGLCKQATVVAAALQNVMVSVRMQSCRYEAAMFHIY